MIQCIDLSIDQVCAFPAPGAASDLWVFRQGLSSAHSPPCTVSRPLSVSRACVLRGVSVCAPAGRGRASTCLARRPTHRARARFRFSRSRSLSLYFFFNLVDTRRENRPHYRRAKYGLTAKREAHLAPCLWYVRPRCWHLANSRRRGEGNGIALACEERPNSHGRR